MCTHLLRKSEEKTLKKSEEQSRQSVTAQYDAEAIVSQK